MIKRKLFLINIEKEEKWINNIINDGYRLKQVYKSECDYEFTKRTSEDVPVVRIDYREFKNDDDYNNYIAMFEDCGWGHIWKNKKNGKQYFEKLNPDADNEIFSDNKSKAERYKRISKRWLAAFTGYIPLLVVFSTTGIFDFTKLFHWKELYYTPGLWELTGARFWRAFLFETPFAFGRGCMGYLFLLIILCYAYFSLKSLYWYKKGSNAK